MEYFTINFICNYKMDYYPFDIQECIGTISIDNNFFVRLVAKDLSYAGPENLMKYNFKNISFVQKVQVKLSYPIDCWSQIISGISEPEERTQGALALSRAVV